MPTHYELGECDLSPQDLAYVGTMGVEVWRFDHQPTTDDIARHRRQYSHVVQKIGNLYEVYDLRTVRLLTRGSSTWTIGLPVSTHDDCDAAIMAALLSV